MTETAGAVDRLAARFDHAPTDGDEAPRLADLRITAVEAHQAAEQLTTLLTQVERVVSSDDWDRRVEVADSAATHLADALVLRGAGLVALLVAGLALVRLVPQRSR